ncbi:MAG: hypothetical protein HOQ05_07225 [Corynebacteriales bacterium]|nr:hypothetical protein [Mycobacteriales bacterium]
MPVFKYPKATDEAQYAHPSWSGLGFTRVPELVPFRLSQPVPMPPVLRAIGREIREENKRRLAVLPPNPAPHPDEFIYGLQLTGPASVTQREIMIGERLFHKGVETDENEISGWIASAVTDPYLLATPQEQRALRREAVEYIYGGQQTLSSEELQLNKPLLDRMRAVDPTKATNSAEFAEDLLTKAVLDYRAEGLPPDPTLLFESLGAAFDVAHVDRDNGLAEELLDSAFAASRRFSTGRKMAAPAVAFTDQAERHNPTLTAPHAALNHAIKLLPYEWPILGAATWPETTPWAKSAPFVDLAWNPSHGITDAARAEAFDEETRVAAQIATAGPRNTAPITLTREPKGGARREPRSARKARQDAVRAQQPAPLVAEKPEPELEGLTPKEFATMFAELAATLPPVVATPGIPAPEGVVPLFIPVSPDLYAIATTPTRRRTLNQLTARGDRAEDMRRLAADPAIAKRLLDGAAEESDIEDGSWEQARMAAVADFQNLATPFSPDVPVYEAIFDFASQPSARIAMFRTLAKLGFDMTMLNVVAPKPPPETSAWLQTAQKAISSVSASASTLQHPVPEAQLGLVRTQAAGRYKSLASTTHRAGGKTMTQEEALTAALNKWQGAPNYATVVAANGAVVNEAVQRSVHLLGQSSATALQTRGDSLFALLDAVEAAGQNVSVQRQEIASALRVNVIAKSKKRRN